MLIFDAGPAGRMIRRLLPAGIAVQVALGWLVLEGQRAGFYGAGGAAALLVAGNVATIVLIVFWSSRLLRAADQRRCVAEERTEFNALHDALTGLANRSLFMDRLSRRTALAERRGGPPFAVFCVDLDNFCQVNDRLGQAAGDQLLIAVGQILRSCVRASDLVARLGGDEFAILLEELDDPRDVGVLANRILASIPRAHGSAGVGVPVGVSIGIALHAPRHVEPGDLLSDADAALQRAKAAGKARYEIAF